MLINEAFCKSSCSTCPSNEPSTFNFLSSTQFLNGKVTMGVFLLENQLFMLTGELVLFDFGPRLPQQVHSWSTSSLWDEHWLKITAFRQLSSQMMYCAPGADTSFCLQIHGVCLLSGTTGKCISRNLNSLV